MSRFDVVTVAVRLFALAVLFNLIESVPRLVSLHLQTSETGFTFMILTTITQFLAALLILLIAPGVAALLLPRKAQEVPISPWSKYDVLITGIIMIGLFGLFGTIRDATYWIVLLIRRAHYDSESGPLSHERVANILATMAEGATSLAMVISPNKVLSIVSRHSGKR